MHHAGDGDRGCGNELHPTVDLSSERGIVEIDENPIRYTGVVLVRGVHRHRHRHRIIAIGPSLRRRRVIQGLAAERHQRTGRRS